jgi:hypothetical protein
MCAEMHKLKGVPKEGFGFEVDVTVAVGLMVNHVAPSTTIAVQVLQLLLTGGVATKEAVRKRLNKIVKGVTKEAGFPATNFSPQSVEARLKSTFWQPPPPILTLTQQAKADAEIPPRVPGKT